MGCDLQKFDILVEIASKLLAADNTEEELRNSSSDDENRNSNAFGKKRKKAQEEDEEFTCDKKSKKNGKAKEKGTEMMLANAKNKAFYNFERPEMPEKLKLYIKHIVKTDDVQWLNIKFIFPRDAKEDQNSLNLPSNTVEVLSKKETCRLKQKAGIDVDVLDPRGVVWVQNFKFRVSLHKYVLKTCWNDFVKENGIRPEHDTAEIWLYRYGKDRLGFVINIVPSEKYFDPSSDIYVGGACETNDANSTCETKNEASPSIAVEKNEDDVYNGGNTNDTCEKDGIVPQTGGSSSSAGEKNNFAKDNGASTSDTCEKAEIDVGTGGSCTENAGGFGCGGAGVDGTTIT